MPDVWYRGWEAFSFYSRSSYYQFGPRLLEGQSLLRMYISWHVVGLPRAIDEPLFFGCKLIHGAPGSIAPPDDPSQTFGRLTGDWLALETWHPYPENTPEDTPWRVVWPGSGMRIWDIKANRRADGEHIVPFLVWSLGAESFGQVAPRFTWSALHREP